MKMNLQKNTGEYTVDDFLSVMEQFEKAYREPVQTAFIVPPAHYDEMKNIFDGTGIKVVKNQSIDLKKQQSVCNEILRTWLTEFDIQTALEEGAHIVNDRAIFPPQEVEIMNSEVDDE